MNKVIHRFDLDLEKQDSQVYVCIRKTDTGHRLEVMLRVGGNPFTFADGDIVVLSCQKTGGHININGTIEDNKIVVDLTAELAAAAAEWKCDFNLIGIDGTLLVTPPFTILVDYPAATLN